MVTSYATNRRSRHRRRRWGSVVFKLVVAVLFIGGGISAGGWVLRAVAQSSYTLSASSGGTKPIPTPVFVSLDKEAAFRTVLKNFPDLDASVYFAPVGSVLQATINETKTYRGASTTKLIAATYFLHQVEQGKFSLNQKLGDYTASYQLEQMINQSNNDSWETFLQANGEPAEEAYAHSIGLSSFAISTNTIDATDLASLLQQLWQGKLLNTNHTQLLFSLMQNTNDDTWLPPGLPQGAVVYHKYGDLEDDVHDAAIVQYKGQAWVLVIMTNGRGVYDYDTRHELFTDLVQAAFR